MATVNNNNTRTETTINNNNKYMNAMKTNIITSALFAALLITSTAFAGTEPSDDKITAKVAAVQVSTYKTVDNNIRVNIEKKASIVASILIRDANGQVVYSQHIGKKTEKLAAKFDVSNLEDGTYQIQVVSKEGTISKEINLKTATEQPKRLLAVN